MFKWDLHNFIFFEHVYTLKYPIHKTSLRVLNNHYQTLNSSRNCIGIFKRFKSNLYTVFQIKLNADN